MPDADLKGKTFDFAAYNTNSTGTCRGSSLFKLFKTGKHTLQYYCMYRIRREACRGVPFAPEMMLLILLC